MFFRLRFIIGQLREWTTRSKSRRSVAGGLDVALLIEEKLIFSAKYTIHEQWIESAKGARGIPGL